MEIILMDTNVRTPVAKQDLYNLVDVEVASLLVAQLPFTVYNVTRNLRTANPGLEIVHSEVKPLVRFFMSPLPENWMSDYVAQANGQVAQTWSWVDPTLVDPPADLVSASLPAPEPTDVLFIGGEDDDEALIAKANAAFSLTDGDGGDSDLAALEAYLQGNLVN
jgi:hypothetical protein